MFTTMGPDWSLLEVSDDANDYLLVVVRGRFLRPDGRPIGRPRLLGVAGVDGTDQFFCRLALDYPGGSPAGRFAEISTVEVWKTRVLLHDWWLEAHRPVRPGPMACPVDVLVLPRKPVAGKSVAGKSATKAVGKPARRK